MQMFMKDQELKIWNIVNRYYIPIKVKKGEKGEEIILKVEEEFMDEDRARVTKMIEH